LAAWTARVELRGREGGIAGGRGEVRGGARSEARDRGRSEWIASAPPANSDGCRARAARRSPRPEARGAETRSRTRGDDRARDPGVPRRSRDARSRDSTAARSPRDGTGRDARGVRHRSASAIERFFRSPAGSGARAPGTAASTHRRATEARGATARTAAADMVRAAILIDVVRAEMADRSSRARRKSSQHAGDANPAGGRWRAAWQPRRDEPIRRARLDGKKRWGLEPPNEGSRSTRNEETLTGQTTV
jgi:hypothetical protein